MDKTQLIRQSLTTYSAVIVLIITALLYMNLGGLQSHAYASGSLVNICGTSPASGNWSQHDANPACQGCTSSGSCSGPVVRVYRCNKGQEMSNIECRANEQNVGGSVTFDAAFNDPCQLIQIDVFSDNGYDNLKDFVVFKGANFDSQAGCGVTPPVTTPPAACPYLPVNTEFFAHTNINQDATSWFSGNNINVKNVPVYMDINCFANNGQQLLPNAKVKVTFHDGTTAIYNTPSPRDIYLSQPGNYTAVCYTEEHGGLNGLCTNTDQFTLNGGVTTPPVTTPPPVTTKPPVTTPPVTTPVVTTPPPVTTKPPLPTIPVTDL